MKLGIEFCLNINFDTILSFSVKGIYLLIFSVVLPTADDCLQNLFNLHRWNVNNDW